MFIFSKFLSQLARACFFLQQLTSAPSNLEVVGYGLSQTLVELPDKIQHQLLIWLCISLFFFRQLLVP